MPVENTDLTPDPVAAGITRGRCATCAAITAHELPLRTIYFCKQLLREMDGATKDAVHDCPVWVEMRTVSRRSRAEQIRRMLGADVLGEEDELFSELRARLNRCGVDLRTTMILAHPSFDDPRNLEWIDAIPPFEGDPDGLKHLLERLRAMRWETLADYLTPLANRPIAENS